ncbi:MAG: aminodeoxychorismate lyase [Thiobacillaceae bacterium]
MRTEPLTLVDGVRHDAVPARDRGLLYGDGVFRTLRVHQGRPRWWSAHMRKLAEDAARLAIPAPLPASWAREVAALLSQAPAECVLKLILTRGTGLRGYRPASQPEPRRILQISAWPEHIETVAARGAVVHVCDLRLAEQPRLAGIKHLNRLENVLAAREWRDGEADEGLLLDHRGRVVCGVSSNVFLVRQGRLLTPRLTSCGVAGVARQQVLALAAQLKLPAAEVDIGLEELKQADEVFLTNSLIRLWPVCRLGDRQWGEVRLATELRRLLDDVA